MKPVAIIPARGGSKRIPRKNIADVGGLPMLAYPVRAALESGLFSRVFVSTEDAEIAAAAQAQGAEVAPRPEALAGDEVFEVDVYRQLLETLEEQPPFFCGIYATAVFITPDDLRTSFALLDDPAAPADCVMSVSRYQIHPFKALEADKSGYLGMVYPKECMMRSQTYPDYVASNGTFYWLRTEAFLKKPSYYQPRLRGYILPAERAVDIDEPEDLDLARALMAVKSHAA